LECNHIELSLLTNGFSKIAMEEDAKEALNRIAEAIGNIPKPDLTDHREPDLAKFEPRHLAMLVNGFSKLDPLTDAAEKTSKDSSSALLPRSWSSSPIIKVANFCQRHFLMASVAASKH
jgi:hypothetical protein